MGRTAGISRSAQQLSAVTATNLHGGGFASIVQTQDLLAAVTEENLGGLFSPR
ncbi:hypothetical protein [Glutamicibacter sp.]|uniref:hypothetical protein n=1 Tax=Glutamicibacter sp. TaxID=1931995 RepID=UPI0028BD8427|nr:hypothetical protein [Glutamicibacter sp.]